MTMPAAAAALLMSFCLVHLVRSSNVYCGAGSKSVPRRPPQVMIGNYETLNLPFDNSVRDILIYWHEIEEFEKCDRSFVYRAYYTTTTYDNRVIMHQSNHTYDNHALFIGLRSDTAYNFRVYSTNGAGLSADFASLYVASADQEMKAPAWLNKKEYFRGGYTVYELSWPPAEIQTPAFDGYIDYYTLFWCDNVRDDHHLQCMGRVYWQHLPITVNTMALSRTMRSGGYVFAISTNRMKNGYGTEVSVSSGMVWETCNPLYHGNIVLQSNIWTPRIGSTFFGLRMKLDCTDRSDMIDSYHIIYCPVDYVNSFQCIGPESKRIIDTDLKHDRVPLGFIVNLKPSTMYLVYVHVYVEFDNVFSLIPYFKTKPQYIITPSPDEWYW